MEKQIIKTLDEALKSGIIIEELDGTKYRIANVMMDTIDWDFSVCIKGCNFCPHISHCKKIDHSVVLSGFDYKRGKCVNLSYFHESNLNKNVARIYKDSTCTEVLWERKVKPTLTVAEKEILKNLDPNVKMAYIARDKDGDLCCYEYKPIKYNISWSMCEPGNILGKSIHLDMFEHLFQFVKWEDKEPYNIKELLKGE